MLDTFLIFLLLSSLGVGAVVFGIFTVYGIKKAMEKPKQHSNENVIELARLSKTLSNNCSEASKN